MTHPTDEELDALVARLTWHREHCVTGKLVYANEDGPDAAIAITTLRTQLAEVMAQNERLWVANERLVKQLDEASADIDRIAVERGKYKSACVMHRDKVQELILDVIPEATARADRAEAALAVQIEDACAVIDAHSEYDQSVCCDGRECGCQGASVHDTMKHFIRQPHDRTALDRMLAEAEARGIKRAADRTLGLATGHECRTVILAMIEKPDAAR